jgi:hypothetical protein
MEPKELAKAVQDAIDKDMEAAFRDGVTKAVSLVIKQISSLLKDERTSDQQADVLRALQDSLVRQLTDYVSSPHPIVEELTKE